MSLNRKLKVGVVGVGYLGQHHARIYAAIPEVDLLGVYDVNRDRAKEVAGRYHCEVFNSIEALGRVCDAVSVVVPTDCHHQTALSLLRLGCHLLVEKPLCTHLFEAEEMMALAREKRLIVQVGHIEHYNPVMAYLEKVVHIPRYITADRLAPFNPRGTEVGVVLDLMIHDIGIILQLNPSPIKSIEAVGVNVLSKSEDIANARIQFENGCVANINTSRVSQKKVREIRVFQEDAYVSMDFMNQEGHFLRRMGRDLERHEIPVDKDEPLKLELDSFITCLQKKEGPKVGLDLGKSALEVAIKVTDTIQQQIRAYE